TTGASSNRTEPAAAATFAQRGNAGLAAALLDTLPATPRVTHASMPLPGPAAALAPPPSSGPAKSAIAESTPAAKPQVQVSAPPPAAASRPAPSSVPSGAAPTGARTPINPFLANDPHAKAKRLARALVSDLVTYFPHKRQDGLRDGTLKQLFKDEIQKSYEEYVTQVGREFAETTPHYQEALNDLLAGGQKVF